MKENARESWLLEGSEVEKAALHIFGRQSRPKGAPAEGDAIENDERARADGPFET